jgi:aminoglycoside phosphotransferase (APT) family kinase protein
MILAGDDTLLVVIVCFRDKMMKRPISKIHGHSLEDMQNLLCDTCECIEKGVVLCSTSIGGWSNINIRGTSQELEFVLKVPWSIMHYDTNPYSKLFALLTYLSKFKLTEPPIAFGRLPDKNETPYMILPYVKGKIYSSIEDATREELLALKDTLHRLSLQKPPGLKKYTTPSEYMIEINDRISRNRFLSSCSKAVESLIHSFQKQYTKLSSDVEALGTWSGILMHGDLWEPNILFQNGRITLLDFESCSYGDPLFDLAYLLEAADRPPMTEPPFLLSSENRNLVKSYRPIALMALVNWSLERLLFMDAGQVEENINTSEIRDNIVRYTSAKLFRLGTH